MAHSENFFGDYRDFWWNPDFLVLMAKRLGLKRHKTLLDVGAGRCHWSRLLVPHLAKNPQVTAIDNDPKWVREGAEIQKGFKKLGASLDVQHSDAHLLPFADNSFDMVTCQTVLIHLENPALALSEMKRVLKPNGTLLCVEPNNRVQSLLQNSLNSEASIEEILDHVKYVLLIEQGKKKLGQGDNSLGDLLPGMFAEQGLKKIQSYLSDKAISMYPPYENPEQTATLQQWAQGSSWKSDETDELTYVEALGDEHVAFYEEFQRKYSDAGNKMMSALLRKEYHSAGGAMMYLVAGEK